MIEQLKNPKLYFRIFVALLHFALLFWIGYLLINGSLYTTFQLMIHFIGMAVFGGLLIAFSSYCARHELT
jgi:apolipoprotein N-acyltransferase